MSTLFNLLSGPDFTSDSGSSGTAGLGKDVIIDYGNTGNSNSYSYSDGPEEDDEEEYEGYEDGDVEEEEEEYNHQIMKILEEDVYFTQFGALDFFFQYKEKIVYCYDQFCKYSPLHFQGRGEFTENELLGLEYLMDPRRPRFRHSTTREFPPIYFSLESDKLVSKPVEGVRDTFLVLRSFDYAFSYIIEMALLDKGSKRLPDFVWKERNYQREEKMRLHNRNICQRTVGNLAEHRQQCAFGWVLYTKSNGELMKYCTEVQSRNKYIQYNHDEKFLSILPLSFYLVNFLCGPFTEPIEDYDFWVSVPIYYLDIWESGHPSII